MARRNSQRHLDKNQALIYYCQPDPKTKRLRSYQDVADHFNISRAVIERWGAKDSWIERREQWGKELVEEAKIVILDEIDVAQKRHLKVFIELENFATEILKEQALLFKGQSNGKGKFSIWSVSEGAKVLKDAINGQRVILGLPTEIAKAEVTQTNRNLELPPDQAKEFDNFITQNGNKKPLRPILSLPAHQ